MGLGLHGGGLSSAKFLLERGAEITVTDLRDENTLKPSINELDTFAKTPVRYVLGRHEIEDFKNADIVIKNPGVRPDSPFLQVSKNAETDISLFLSESPARLFAVTGTKGKSGTASALHWILNKERKKGRAFLGGNITVSPLTFLDGLTKDDDVVLELSSFQLGDLKNKLAKDGSPLLKPAAAILTTIMADHLDRYTSMEEYVNDKRVIYQGQDANCITVAEDDPWGNSFLTETKGQPIIRSRKQGLHSPLQNGGWITKDGTGLTRLSDGKVIELVPQSLLTPGYHQKLNLLSAALAAYALGTEAQTIRKALIVYPGIEHRLEFFHEAGGVRFYNDSAATIPEAAAACIEALLQTQGDPQGDPLGGLILVTGGTDKNLDFSPLVSAAKNVKKIILLAGTGSEKLKQLLNDKNIAYCGPFDNLDNAVHCALENAFKGDKIALSPGCASFGMFLNEFDRGKKWKEAVLRLSS